MSAIYLLLPLSLLVALGFLAAFIWAVCTGQYEDTYTPSLRVLAEEPRGPKPLSASPDPEPNNAHES